MSTETTTMSSQTTTLTRDCVISGGGPAGMVLGFMLARAGLSVSVLEKHGDFFRDFRGDTIHPSTLTLLGELGLRDDFLQLPLSRLPRMDASIDGQRLTLVDFSTLKKPDNFLILAPQWDFLNFLADRASSYPGFDLRMDTAATGLIIEDGTVRGLRAVGPQGELTVRAGLTVAADGRSSTLREAAGFVPRESGVPIDVLWFNLPKPADPPPATLGYLSTRGMVLTIERTDYYQAGVVIPKGGFEDLKTAGLQSFRDGLVFAAGHLESVVGTLQSWDQVKLLSVQINRLPRWHRPGFIAIGDAAHAMSPMFGVGVNYAIQDAVALANAVVGELADGVVADATLAAVQRRRQRPAARMQLIQRVAQQGLVRAALGRRDRVAPRWVIGVLRALSPLIRRLAARFVGIGLLPEHVRTPVQADPRVAGRLGSPG